MHVHYNTALVTYYTCDCENIVCKCICFSDSNGVTSVSGRSEEIARQSGRDYKGSLRDGRLQQFIMSP